MQLSKHNIISGIKDSDSYFIINPLSRNADIIDSETLKMINDGSYPDNEELRAKAYLVDPQEEEKRFRAAYLDFLDSRDEDEIQIFYVPTYACNFSCSYCYQEGYGNEKISEPEEVIDAFFRYVDSEFAGKRKYITVFGGEPLLPDTNTRKKIEHIINSANQRGFSLAFVSNGYSLKEYVPLLKTASIREVQVTLDGPEEIHNSRRMLKGGDGTFSRIVEGINAALEAGLAVNLRAVIDKDNLKHLPELAAFAKEQGWTGSSLFKTQLGRNYELHYCQADQKRLYDRLSMYEDLYSLIIENPVIMDFHRPAYSVSRFLFDNGEMPDPLFDSCPGCKTEWAFDYNGNIFSCTATVGKPGEALGSFYPEKTLKQDIVDTWQERDITSIPECRNCSLSLACGGGCASVAQNSSGTVASPDCRPVKELLSLGIGLYFNEDQER